MNAHRARFPLLLAALSGGTAVALGAFAAHAMKADFEPAQVKTFETGVRYQMYHALALLACAALQAHGLRCRAAILLFSAGTVLFSGSLYGLALTSAKWFGPITPIGGVAFLLGWVTLAFAARNRD